MPGTNWKAWPTWRSHFSPLAIPRDRLASSSTYLPLRKSASWSMCALFRARGPIRNTIAKRFPGHCRNFGSRMNMSRSLVAVARAKNIASEVNAFWENQSFHNYADYAMGGAFRSGLARLRELASVRRCAVMCAEAVWWRCHRRIIADYLLVAGERVFHILGPKVVAPASLTKSATPHPDGALTYPARAAKASSLGQGFC